MFDESADGIGVGDDETFVSGTDGRDDLRIEEW